MSGKGGSPPPGQPTQDCGSLSFRTYLASPDPAAVGSMSVGTVFSVELDTSGAFPIVAVREGTRTVGAIAEGQVGTILRCLQEGYRYEAEVLTIEGARVNLLVRPVTE